MLLLTHQNRPFVKQFLVKRIFLYVRRRVKNFSYQKAFVFLVCLALSSFLWLLSSLEKHYTSRITVPVNYVDFPKDKQLSGSLPQNFDLLVDAYGYTLLSYNLHLAFSPIQINVSELVDNVTERGSKEKYTILTVNHLQEIEKQISSEIRILSIKPDTLIFNFSKIVTRKIKVKPNIRLGFENQYSLGHEPTTLPDSIVVSGPKNMLDTMKTVPTNFREFSKLATSVEQTIPVRLTRGLTTETKEVHLTIPVEQNTEVDFEVPIQVLHLPADVTLKMFPGKVKVACRIGLGKYKNLDYSAFRAFIDYENINGNSARLPVTFESHSNVVLNVNFSPKEVEYILEHVK